MENRVNSWRSTIMSLVKRDEFSILRTASESAETAKNAEHDQQIMAVACLINESANTGLTQVLVQMKLLDSVKEELESKGYKIKYVHNNAYDMQKHALVIWDNFKAGDDFPEPSNSGPKYNTHPEKQNVEQPSEETANTEEPVTDDSANDTPSDSTSTNTEVIDGDDPVDDDI